LGINLNQYDFCKTDAFSPVETNLQGVYVAGTFEGPKDIPETVIQASAAASKAGSLLTEARGTAIIPRQYPPETDVKGQKPRVGVFICHCGINIASVVNIPEVVEYVKKLPNVVHVENNLYTCSQDTQKRMIEKIKELNLNRVVVASCTPRTHEALFRDTIRQAGLNPYLFEMANIRDHCSWVHSAYHKEATKKAKDLIRMALAKSYLLEPLYGKEVDINKDVLVIGGGLSGMTAALELASQGFKVHLVEKESQLGGTLRKIFFLLDGEDPQQRLEDMINKVKAEENIHVYTNTTITDMEGSIGNFVTTLNGSKKTIKHGAVIVATGAKEAKSEEYLYGEAKNVITQLELEERLKIFDASLINSRTIVMIQCVGSREEKRPYCSRICCSQAIKNALRLKDANPDLQIIIIYRDIRTYGFREEFYRKARERGIIFIRYDIENKPKVYKDNNVIKVVIFDKLIGSKIQIEPDWLVLSTGIMPNEDNQDLSQILKVSLAENGFFLEAHMKLRPVDFSKDGVFLCGLAHGPKDVSESISQALGTASRASTIVSKDKLKLDAALSYVVDDNCDGCAYCIDPCPFNALTLIEYKWKDAVKKTVQVDESRCKGCGVCMATCPKRGIYVKHFKLEMLQAMIEAALAE
jgi:heterodisulfide reductase subunit A